MNCLSPVALFRTRDLQPVSLEGYRRSRQRVRWLHSIPGHEFEQTLGDTGVAKTHTQHHHLHMLLTFNFLEILLFSKFLSFIHRYRQGSFMLLSLRKSLTNPLHCHHFSLMIFSIFYFSRGRRLLLLTPSGLLFKGMATEEEAPSRKSQIPAGCIWDTEPWVSRGWPRHLLQHRVGGNGLRNVCLRNRTTGQLRRDD